MTTSSALTSIFALLFVLLLIWGLAKILQRTNLLNNLVNNKNTTNRLKVLETRIIDPRNKLVLISRDSKEHLILINADKANVIESIESLENLP